MHTVRMRIKNCHSMHYFLIQFPSLYIEVQCVQTSKMLCKKKKGTYFNFSKMVNIIKVCFVFKKHHAYAYIGLYMRKNNKKLNFAKNHWASLFSHRTLKISKC